VKDFDDAVSRFDTMPERDEQRQRERERERERERNNRKFQKPRAA